MQLCTTNQILKTPILICNNIELNKDLDNPNLDKPEPKRKNFLTLFHENTY